MPNITTNHAITDANSIDAKKVFSDTISITASSLWCLIRSQNDIFLLDFSVISPCFIVIIYHLSYLDFSFYRVYKPWILRNVWP